MLQDVLLPPHTAADLTDAVINRAYRLKGDTGGDRAWGSLRLGSLIDI